MLGSLSTAPLSSMAAPAVQLVRMSVSRRGITMMSSSSHRMRRHVTVTANRRRPVIGTTISPRQAAAVVASSYFSSSSCVSTTQQRPLARWRQVLTRISLPSSPLTEGNKQELRVQALLGDKILGLAVTRALIESSSSSEEAEAVDVPSVPRLDTGCLTPVISATVSNRFLARHARTILADTAWMPHDDDLHERDAGTRVEAAVRVVHDADPAAVRDLASFLLDAHARQRRPDHPKSRLLEMGGRLDVERTGGGDHDPVFTATATMSLSRYADDRSRTATARGPSKKRAELLAAAQVLHQLEDDDDRWTSTLWRFDDDDDDDDDDADYNYRQWRPFALSRDEITLKGQETPSEWWLRGATDPRRAFSRALVAPRVFSDVIASVDSWTWRHHDDDGSSARDHDAVAVMAVIVTHPPPTEPPPPPRDVFSWCHTVPAQTGASANQARRLVGLEANRIIASLVGLELDTKD